MDHKERGHLHGRYECQIVRDGKVIDEWADDNIVVDEGLDYLLDAAIAGNTASTTWYVGLLSNYTPVAGSTMTNFGGNEITAYTGGVRPTYVIDGGAASSQAVSNSSSKASFTMTGAATVYGVFLSDSSTQDTSGTAFSGVLFGSSKSLTTDDELLVTYTLTAADDGA